MRLYFHSNMGSKVRYETLEGRKHIVAPVGLLGETVISGSEGPYLYPRNENEKSTTRWNAMPVVVYHPKIDNRSVSARDPEIFNSRKVGVLMNAAHPDDKLVAEVWLDEERLREVDVRVLEALEAGKQVETSTGLTAETDNVPGEFNGKKYKGKLTAYEPDHLAILPDEIGAFSIAMGGGLLANSVAKEENRVELVEELLRPLTASDLGRAEVTNSALPDGSFSIENADDLRVAVRAVRRAHNQSAAIAHIKRRAKELGLLSMIPDEWSRFKVANAEVSMSEIGRRVQAAIQDNYGSPDSRAYVEEVYPSSVVFSGGSPDYRLYKIGYKKVGDQIQLSSDGPVEVVRVTDYRPVANSSGDANPVLDPKGGTMNEAQRLQAVNALIANGWAETDREFLNSLTPERLTKLSTPVAPPAVPPVAPPAPPPPASVTLSQLVANADPAVQQMFADMQASHDREKATHVAKIKANPNNMFSEAALNAMALPNLRAIAALVPDPQQQQLQNGFDLTQVYPDMVGGQFALNNGYAPPLTTNADAAEDPAFLGDDLFAQ